ncbi:MAG: tetratricopeptide repeat protein [Acidobacteria bacterium]|nr:tetratricopeptide repeat protein [Acidobacteriota bacterium]
MNRLFRSWLCLALALSAAAQTAENCSSGAGGVFPNREAYDQFRQTCLQGLLRSANPAVQAEGYWVLRQYKEANEKFKAAVAQYPKNPDYRVRWGRLLLERFNKADAADLFGEALVINPNHAGATLGLALVASDGFDVKAVELAEKAVQLDPKLVEAQTLLAKLALEDNNPEKAAAEAQRALKISANALEAMAVLATIDWLNDKPNTPWEERIRKRNPIYGEAYAIAAHFLVLNRRYEEGIRFYRKALEIDPTLDEARAQLGVNLMRLGLEQEARAELERAYNNGFTNALTANSLTLMDSYKNFVTRKTRTTVLKLHKKEADLLGPYFEDELKRAIATYEKKYHVKLDRPVQLEVYPDHEDFAVRTLGMPGLGALGVTFGYVVAMDSPSGRKPGSFHWASTLWHELSHVFVLAATNHRVPRWFTEGMAVHEETAVSPDWGDRLDPETISAIRNKKLLPVAQLDRGFIRPAYPGQVTVSYFQAGRICDYIAQNWSYQKLLDMMHSFGKGKSTPQVVEEHLGVKPEEFDVKFLTWLDSQVKRTADGFDGWRKRLRAIAEAAKAGRHDDVIREGKAIRDIYPDYVEAGSVYEFLADAYLAKGEKQAAMQQLEKYALAGGRSPKLIQTLATLQEELGKKQEAAYTLARLNLIYPMDEELHKRLGDLWMESGNLQGAIREYRAVVASRPIDAAAAHYNLARALKRANRAGDAKEQVLLALEAAPGFKPAQKLLLELSQ